MSSEADEIALDPAAFWRYAGAIETAALVAVLGELSTRRPTGETIQCVFRGLGAEIRYLVGASQVYHLFANPDSREAHILDCLEEKSRYQRCTIEVRLPVDDSDPWSWFLCRPLGDAGMTSRLPREAQVHQLWEELNRPSHVCVAPFCQNDFPLGYFLFVWRQPAAAPALFSERGDLLREGGMTILSRLHGVVANLLSNHYPIHRDTYLPTFMQPVPRRIAIMFADIRNSTTAFEAMRLHGIAAHGASNPLIGLVKSYLAAASQVIAYDGVGGIDKFIGDGIMATFGEYLSCGASEQRAAEENQSLVACLLATCSASVLVDAFDKLQAAFFRLPAVIRFMYEFNEWFDLRAGIGINFGEVSFDYFGTSTGGNGNKGLIGGYLEFTAVGDNVNTAQRLESIAGKPVAAVGVIDRSPGRASRSPNYMAPIILSRTAFLRVQGALRVPFRTTGGSLAEEYQSAVALRGKGGLAEVYEVSPEELDGNYVLRTLSDLKLTRLEAAVRQYWDEDAKSFRFPEARAVELIQEYCCP